MTTKRVLHESDITNKHVTLHQTLPFDNKMSLLLLQCVRMWVWGQLADCSILVQQLN